MIHLLKLGPIEASDNVFRAELRTSYDRGLSLGDFFFLWESETQGGNGLSGYGRVLEITRNNGITRLTGHIEQRPDQSLGNNILSPLRDTVSDRADCILAKRIYKISLNQSAPLTEAEINFIWSFFGN